jgi:hypothetical protein
VCQCTPCSVVECPQDHLLTALSFCCAENCKRLTALSSRITEATALTLLDAFGCEALKCLPYYMGQLKSLQDLDISHCTSLLALPDSIGERTLSYASRILCLVSPWFIRRFVGCLLRQCGHRCTGGCSSLTSLSAGFCRGLQQLPTSVGSLSNLVSLDLQWCESLQHLPSSVGQLHKLWRLQVGSLAVSESIPFEFALLATRICTMPLMQSIRLSILCSFQAVQPWRSCRTQSHS